MANIRRLLLSSLPLVFMTLEDNVYFKRRILRVQILECGKRPESIYTFGRFRGPSQNDSDGYGSVGLSISPSLQYPWIEQRDDFICGTEVFYNEGGDYFNEYEEVVITCSLNHYPLTNALHTPQNTCGDHPVFSPCMLPILYLYIRPLGLRVSAVSLDLGNSSTCCPGEASWCALLGQ